MTFQEKIQDPLFWKNTLTISGSFFVTLVIISILFDSFSAVIHFDWAQVNEINFADGKWKSFFLIKGAISLVYGIWMTARKMK